MARTNPADANARLARARRAFSERRFGDADRDVAAVLTIAPAHRGALGLRASLLQIAGRFREAADILEALARLQPRDVALLNSLAIARHGAGDSKAAIEAFRSAVALAPDHAEARANLGKALVDTGDLDEGCAEIEQALALNPGLMPPRFTLAYAHRTCGRVREAERVLRGILERSPEDGNAWLGLADIDAAFDATDIERMRAALASSNVTGRSRSALGFALGRALEAAGDHDGAWSALVEANASVRVVEPWNARAASERCESTLAAFESEGPAAPEGLGAGLVFIVGLPRSGSTLIEQILAAHEDVEPGGERRDLPLMLSTELDRRGLPTLQAYATAASAEDWERLGREYLSRTLDRRHAATRHTDKLPGNWLLVGAIRRMLPGARVIICRRDPVETAVACFARLFAPRAQPFSYDLADIASYWRDFDRSARAWTLRFPDAVRVQHYETLVADPEGEIPALLDFAGLSFDPACLRFHETTRAIHTHSALQVRKPLQARRTRASRYGERLDALRRALVGDEIG